MSSEEVENFWTNRFLWRKKRGEVIEVTVDDPDFTREEVVLYFFAGIFLSLVIGSLLYNAFQHIYNGGVLAESFLLFVIAAALFALLVSGFLIYLDRCTILVLGNTTIESYLFPFRKRQKVFIKDIVSIDIQYQRYIWFGRKKRLDPSLEKHYEDGYYSFKINLQNQRSKTLKFKMTYFAAMKQLRDYMLNPENYPREQEKEYIQGDPIVYLKKDRIDVVSQELSFDEEKAKRTVIASSFFISFFVWV